MANPQEPASRPAGSTRWNWIAGAAGLASLLAIVLALLGYGTSLAIEGRLGMPHALVYASTLDLFALGGLAVVHIVAHLGPALASAKTYVELLIASGPLALGAFIGWAALILLQHLSRKHLGAGGVPAVACLAVTDGQGNTFRGRAVLTTSRAVILFDPATGAVRRVPAEGATVELIPTLDR